MFCYLFLGWALFLGHSSHSIIKHSLSRFSIPQIFCFSLVGQNPSISLNYIVSVITVPFLPHSSLCHISWNLNLDLHSTALSQGIFINSHTDFRSPLCTGRSYSSALPWKFQLFQETNTNVCFFISPKPLFYLAPLPCAATRECTQAEKYGSSWVFSFSQGL